MSAYTEKHGIQPESGQLTGGKWVRKKKEEQNAGCIFQSGTIKDAHTVMWPRERVSAFHQNDRPEERFVSRGKLTRSDPLGDVSSDSCMNSSTDLPDCIYVHL